MRKKDIIMKYIIVLKETLLQYKIYLQRKEEIFFNLFCNNIRHTINGVHLFSENSF